MANKKLSLKFHYYFVESTVNEKSADFKTDSNKNLEKLLDRLLVSNYEQRTWRHNKDDDNRVILQSISKENNGFWKLSFVKVRDGALPGRLDAAGEFNEIVLEPDEYIGEDMTVIYSPKHSIIGIQRNFFSVSSSKIEDYFCYQEMELQKSGIQFKLSAILDSKVASDTAIIRSIEVSCYDLSGASLTGVIENENTFGAKRITLNLSMGNAPKKEGLQAAIRPLMKLFSSSGKCTKAKMKYKEDENSPIETIDFIETKIEDKLSVDYSKSDPVTHERIYAAFLPKFKERLMTISNR